MHAIRENGEAGRIEEAEQHIEKARGRRAELEAWLKEQFEE